ncbi:MAG: rhodanese-like domain-containing protein [Planctomycetota bacterium]|jgi:rhodanese-related sulfurtransferase
MLKSEHKNTRIFCRALFLLLYILEGTLGRSAVVADEHKNTNNSVPSSNGPYCGVTCLYTIMKLSDKDVKYKDLLKAKYIGSKKGSSLAELKNAAEDNGMHAWSIGYLTSRVLRYSVYPIILHTKDSPDKKEYNHYELFLGVQDGKARLFDPPEPIRLVPFYELAPVWDGTGLIVSAKPIDLTAIFAPARNRFFLYMVTGLAVIATLHWARRRWPLATLVNSRSKLFGLSIIQTAGFGILALLCGMVYHFANDEGFLAHANATTSIQQAHLGNFIPKVSKNKVERLLGTDTVFIDGYKATAGIGKDAPIVIYCQSAGCKYAEKVTIKLKDDGFINISIFKGGWSEWKAKKDD